MTMKITLCLLMLVSLLASGCDSSLFMTPRVSTALIGNGLGLRITDFRTDGGYRTGENGHGLIVVVWAERDPFDYQPNLKLELEDAAKMFAALAKCDPVMEFDYIDLHYINKYGRIGIKSQLVCGGTFVVIRREKLLELRDANTPASEYPQHWGFVHGFKDRLDSKESLWWRDGSR